MSYQVFDQLIDCIFMCDPETMLFTYATDGALAQLGYSMDELRTMTPADIAPPFTLDEIRTHLGPLLNRSLKTLRIESLHQHRDGTLIPVDLMIQVIQTESGDQIAAVARDVTEQQDLLVQLQQSEALNAAVIESAFDGIAVIDASGIVRSFNTAAARIFGWSAAEVIGRNVNMLMPSPDHEAHDGYLHHYLDTGKKAIIDQARTVQGRRRDGTLFPMQLAVSEVRVDGQILFTGIIHDLSTRLETERALDFSESLLEAFLQNLPSPASIVGLDGEILMANAAMANRYNTTHDKIVGRSIGGLLPPVLEERRMDQYARIVATGRPLSDEITYQDLAGDWRTQLAQRFPVFVDDRVIAVGAIATDITDQLLVEKRLLQHEEMLRTVFEASPDAIVILDLAFVVTEISPAIERVYNVEPEQYYGRPLADLLHPDDRRHVTTNLQELLNQTSGTVRMHYRIQNSAGVWLAVEAIARVLIDTNATPYGVVLVQRDVSEAIATQLALTAAMIEAERANNAKSQFMSRVSHELRTPLNSILGFAQILEMSLPSEHQESVGYIYRAGRHLLELINEVLDISRVESGELALSVEPVSLESSLRDCVDLLWPQARERDIDLIVRDTYGYHVLADQQRLKQVLINLLSNAIKFNREHGTVTVTSETLDGRTRVNVTDSGAGILPEHLAELFVPFERLNAEVEGTGLGLALTKGLIEAMGGTVGVVSTPGQGSTFWFELPSIPDADINPQLLEVIDSPYPINELRGTLLYIEDNLSNLLLIEGILKYRPGLRLVSAMQGSIGIELATQQLPDLILLDLNLPDLPGDIVLQRLRDDVRTASIPIVMVSADATEGQIDRIRAMGASDYITKPIDIHRLFSVLDHYLIH
ncbi:MAG TPA: PAS domain S-box protein [Acidimicrobiales bacterium]|nr:PAS domain S-box protein [Acidimicrobiales bacterium]